MTQEEDFESVLLELTGMTLKEFEREAKIGLQELHKQEQCLDVKYKKINTNHGK